MSVKIMEGQMDFLGLLNEYVDEQGATVRVREPQPERIKVKLPETVSIKNEIVKEKPVKNTEVKKEPEPEQLRFTFEEMTKPAEPVKFEEPAKSEEPVKIEEPVKPSELKRVKPEVKPEIKPEKKIEKKPEVSPRAKTEVIPESTPESIPEVVQEEPKTKREMLFKQCKRCWCFDCKHNSRNEGIPREMCGSMMPCPACNGCVSDDFATICEIGNAKEGCMTRAIEEGIYLEEEM